MDSMAEEKGGSSDMKEKDIVIAKLRARGVSEKAIRAILKYYNPLCPVSDCWFKGV